MTKWTAFVGDILDRSADALICSANPQLNLSGGVGGAILMRYGPSMQDFLYDWLRHTGQRFVSPGAVIAAPSCGTTFRVVLHAVAIDSFYETSPEIIRQAYQSAFSLASDAGCHTIVAACLACGFGRASPTMFIDAIRGLIKYQIAGVGSVQFVSTNAEIVSAVCSVPGVHCD